MKTIDQEIRRLIGALYEEINKDDRKINIRELEKKTAELQEWLSRKKSDLRKGEKAKKISDDKTEAKTEAKTEDKTEDKTLDSIYTIGELVNDSVKKLEIRSRDKSGRFFITTGFQQLDQLIGGFEPGEVIVIGARTGMGKTALLLSMMKNITAVTDHPIGFISLEFPTSQLMERIISAEAEIPVPKLRKADLKVSAWNRIFDGIGDIKNRKIFIVDNPRFAVANIRNVAERLVRDCGIRILIIDYLQMIEPFSKKRTREEEMASIVKEIKQIAKEMRLVVIVASQLNRMVEMRSGDKRPYLSDLKHSGSIEEDTDKVIFIHRPEVYNILEDEKGNFLAGKALLIIAKNRTGPTGEIMLNFNSQYGKFQDIDMHPGVPGNIFPEDLSDFDPPF